MTLQLLSLPRGKFYNIKLLIIILAQISYYLFDTTYHNNIANLNLCIQLTSFYIIVSYINAFIGFISFAKSYIYIMLSMAIGGVIIFFTHLFIGVNPLFYVDYSETGTSYFLWLTTSNVYYNFENIRILRYSGFFDEPGAFGLYALFAILLNKVYFNDKKIELWLIILTIFTLSLAFFIIITIFILLFYLNKRYIKYFVTSFVVAAIFLTYLSTITDNESKAKIFEFTVDRFKVDNGKFAGDNRSHLVNNDKKYFYNFPLLGAGPTFNEERGSNLYAIFAKYGIIGATFFYALLLYMLYLVIKSSRINRMDYFKIILLILLNLFHRPELSSVLALLVFISIIYKIKLDNQLNTQDQNILVLHTSNL